MKTFKELMEKVKEPTGDLKKACWKGYTAVGMKMKNGRKVPNCVPEEVELDEANPQGMSDKEYARHELGKGKKPEVKVGAKVTVDGGGSGVVQKIYDKELYSVLTAPQQEIDVQQRYLQILCRMTTGDLVDSDGRRLAERFTYTVQFHDGRSFPREREFYDYKIDFEKLKRKVYLVVEKKSDVHTIVQVEPTDKGMYGTV